MILTILLCVAIVNNVVGDSTKPYNLLLVREADFYILPFLEHNLEEFESSLGPEAVHHFDDVFNWYKYEMNKALLAWREADPENPLAHESILHILKNLANVPEEFGDRIRHFGGGYANHIFYFAIISPNTDEEIREPRGYLQDEIEHTFGSFENLKEEFKAAAEKVKSSGYVWLVRSSANSERLQVKFTLGQNSVLFRGDQPLVCIDLWEHAYYTQYKHERWNYMEEFFKIIDWDYVVRLDMWWHNIEDEQRKADESVLRLKEIVKRLDDLEAMAKSNGQAPVEMEMEWDDEL